MVLGYLPRSDVWPETNDTSFTEGPRSSPSLSSRPFTSLELEISTRCNLRCPSCPRNVFSQFWIDRDMGLDTFEKILPAFDQFQTIHFRGWGEPLLNPHFSEMVTMASDSGARLVLTTNGQIMPKPDTLKRFENIFFRLDYGTAATYERRNPWARFNRAILNISQAIHLAGTDSAAAPKIVLLLAKNKFSLRELPGYLKTAVRLKPDQVVFYHPYFHVRQIDALSHLPADEDPGLLEHIDGILAETAREAGLEILNEQPDSKKYANQGCEIGPPHNLFTNWKGQVSPCRNSVLPVAGGTYTRYIAGKNKVFESAIFRTLRRDTLDSLIKSRPFREFHLACRVGGNRLKDYSVIKPGNVYKLTNPNSKMETDGGNGFPISRPDLCHQ